MATMILDGKAAAQALLEQLKPKVRKLDPKLVVVQVGDDPASTSYIKQKQKSCEEVGLRHEHKHLSENATEQELRSTIDDLNRDADVTGFFVQLPLPDHLKSMEKEVADLIDPAKDIDGFGARSVSHILRANEDEALPPPTPTGIVTLLEHYEMEIAGKNAVIVGRSTIVGRPVALMLLNRDATVTICHSKTEDLKSIAAQADILVAAVGKPKFITAEMVKPGAVVVDVGINRTDEGLVGDVDFDAVREVASAISPVPGGVGPMTVASLIRNCIRAKELQASL